VIVSHSQCYRYKRPVFGFIFSFIPTRKKTAI
jgi:hypothetical protein